MAEALVLCYNKSNLTVKEQRAMLHFNGLEPVDFKGKQYEPKVDAEKKLRLQTSKFDTQVNADAATEVLASCFEEEEAKEFIRKKLSNADKEILVVYLVSGETGVNRLSRASDGAIEKYIERTLGQNE